MGVGVSSFGQNTRVQQNGNQELSALGAVLWRKKSWVLWPTIIAGLLALASSTSSLPKYKSEARVLIETAREHLLSARRRKDGHL